MDQDHTAMHGTQNHIHQWVAHTNVQGKGDVKACNLSANTCRAQQRGCRCTRFTQSTPLLLAEMIPIVCGVYHKALLLPALLLRLLFLHQHRRT